MRVLGFDLSSVATGYAIIDDGKYVSSGVIRPIKDIALASSLTQKAVKDDLTELTRFFYIVNRTKEIIESAKPDVVVVEDTFIKIFPGAKINGNVQRLLARISGGVLYVWLSEFDPACKKTHIVMASQARARVGCKGTAKKPEVIEFIKQKYDLIIPDDNEADAFILAQYGFVAGIPQKSRSQRKTSRRKLYNG